MSVKVAESLTVVWELDPGHNSDQEDDALHANCPLACVTAGALITLTVG